MNHPLLSSLVQAALGAGLLGVAGFAWLLYFRWRAERDTLRQPLAKRLLAVVGGYLSALLGLLLFHQLEQMGVRVEWERLRSEALPNAIRLSLLIGAVEESAKLFPVLLVVRWGRGFHRMQDGLLYAACAGIGFAGVEGVVLWMQGDLSWMELLARAAAAPLTHALFSIPWGIGLAASIFWGQWHRLLSGLLLSIASHGLYDWVVGSQQVPQIAAALGVLALWLTMLRAITQNGVGRVHAPQAVPARTR